MADSLDAIIQQLDAGYNPSRQAINDRISQLPSQADAQIAGLQGQQTQAFNDITNGARDRGIGFSGIPLSEQATYTSGTFLPAVAKVRQSQNEAQSSLTDALNNVNLDQRKTAYGIMQNQQQMDFQREQQAAAERAAAEARAATNGGAGGFGLGDLIASSGGQQAAGQQASAGPSAQQQSDYNFVQGLIKDVNSGNGNAVSQIISQAKSGSNRSKDILRSFYQLQNKPIPANFRGFL